LVVAGSMCRADRLQTDVGAPPHAPPYLQVAKYNRLGVPQDRELSTVEKCRRPSPFNTPLAWNRLKDSCQG
jgi:hypothetical protein